MTNFFSHQNHYWGAKELSGSHIITQQTWVEKQHCSQAQKASLAKEMTVELAFIHLLSIQYPTLLILVLCIKTHFTYNICVKWGNTLNLSPRLTGFVLLVISHAKNYQDHFLKLMQQLKIQKALLWSLSASCWLPSSQHRTAFTYIMDSNFKYIGYFDSTASHNQFFNPEELIDF